MRTADEITEVMREYLERFGELPDSRRLPDHVLFSLDDMLAEALKRGTPLTDEELEQADDVPEQSTI